MTVVGITGTQEGMTSAQEEAAISLLAEGPIAALHHGDCIGADAEIDALARWIGTRIIVHPPINSAKRAWCALDPGKRFEAKEYRARNRDIVAAADVLWAFPRLMVEEQRSGTWMTVRMARKAGVPVVIVWPDGRVER